MMMLSTIACVAVLCAACVYGERTNAEVKACMQQAASSNNCVETCKASLGSQVPDATWSAVQSCFDHQNKSLVKCTSPHRGGLLNDTLLCMVREQPRNDTHRNTRDLHHGGEHNSTDMHLMPMPYDHDNQTVGGHSNRGNFDREPIGWHGEMSEPVKCLTECRKANFDKCFDGCTATAPKMGNRPPQWNSIERCQNKEALKACIGQATYKKVSTKSS